MKMFKSPKRAPAVALVLFNILLCIGSTGLTAQAPHAPGSATVPVVMLSDLHFDPLQDPDKVPLLAKAPVSEWHAILNAGATATQASRFALVQAACSEKSGADTSYPLLRSALAAAKAQAGAAAFVAVSGDLLVHDLDCRYRNAMGMPASTRDDQAASAEFAEKTTVFVMSEIASTFPQIPVYLALGNNDSRCDHDRLDAHDAYLQATASSVISGLRGVSETEKTIASRTYQSAGYYAVTMPAPMINTRLLVLDDIYMMPKYTDCSADSSDHQGEQEQRAWLQGELQQAKDKRQRVWLLGHLPPVVNADASLTAQSSFCPSGKVVRYQTSNDLADQIVANAATIKLGIFGHTHMDEFFLLPAGSGGVPIKVVGSVSPVSGNLPSFTVGAASPVSAELGDYTVYEASNPTGVGTVWTREYAFDDLYREPGFSPASLAEVIAGFHAAAPANLDASRQYQQHRTKGASGKKLASDWPGYVCSLDNPTAKSFSACVCASR